MITLDDFLNYLRRSKYSPDTLDTYGSLLSNFESWLDMRNKSLDTFTTLDAQEYSKKSYATSSANTFIAAVKSYLRFRVGTLPMGDPNLMQETQRENQIRLLRAGRTPSKIKKSALSVEEVGQLFKKMRDNGAGETELCGAILSFYFGARTTELSVGLKKARINWKKCEMIIPTLKRGGSERYIAWHESITPYLQKWYDAVDGISYPREWITKKLHKYKVGGLTITSRVARKTFQTNMRNVGIDDFYADHILGHVSKSPIADVYTDYSDESFKDKIREIMCDKHYMVIAGLI